MHPSPPEPTAMTRPQSVQASARLTFALAMILLLELLGGAIYASVRVSEALEPDNLVEAAEDAIRANYPEYRVTIEDNVREQGPQVAEEISQQLIESGPEAREWLAGVISRQLEVGLDEATELSVDQFREFLQANRQQVADALDQLDAAPEETEQLVIELENSLERQLGADFQAQARRALELHRRLNDKLETLTNEQAQLDPQELLERRMLRILRALADEKWTDKSEPQRQT